MLRRVSLARAHLFQARPSKFNDRCERTRVNPLISDSLYVDRCVSEDCLEARVARLRRVREKQSEVAAVALSTKNFNFRGRLFIVALCFFPLSSAPSLFYFSS